MTPLGTICICTPEAPRYADFWWHLDALRYPGPVKKDFRKTGVNIARAKNCALEQAEGDWIWFIEDDHDFAPDLLLRLLAHNVDVVTPLVLFRDPPFRPGAVGMAPDQTRRLVPEPGERGLVEAFVSGTAGMLVRRHVWEALPRPWFRVGQNPDPSRADWIGDDTFFCEQVRAAGFHIYCDLDQTMGHFLTSCVTPRRQDDGQWTTQLRIADLTLDLPPASAADWRGL